jgi:uncharacterized protein
VAGIFLAWVTLRSASVWPAVIGHAAINGIAGIAVLPLVLGGDPNLLLGPYPIGIVASIGFTVIALWVFFHPRALAPMEHSDPPSPTATATTVEST